MMKQLQKEKNNSEMSSNDEMEMEGKPTDKREQRKSERQRIREKYNLPINS